MALTMIDGYSTFQGGDVLKAAYSSYGVKILTRTFVDAIGEYRWITQEVSIKNNEVKPINEGKSLGLRSTKELREYEYSWTKDEVTFQKGDVFKGDDGNFYIAEGPSKVWNIKEGTWSAVDSSQMTWSSEKVKLTPHLTVGGSKFSTYVG